MKKVSINNVDREWLSNRDAMEYLGMSSDFFRGLRKSGKLPYHKVGSKSIFYRKKDIDNLIRGNKVT